MTTASINPDGYDRPVFTTPDEATTEYVVRLRDALAALYDDPLSLEAGRLVSALL
ncbi:hypothetical protein [Williamsia sp. M5A3_1d]